MNSKRRAKDYFPHQKLEVYHLASGFFVECWRFADQRRFPDYFMRSQLLRAALSIKLNIAEGASEFRKLEKAKFYRFARRSAGECASFLDDLEQIVSVSEDELAVLYDQLFHVSNLLTQLILSMERAAQPKHKKK